MQATRVNYAEAVLEQTYGECEVKAYITVSNEDNNMMRHSGGVISNGTVIIDGKMVATFSSTSDKHLSVNFSDVEDETQEIVRKACYQYCKDAREYIANADINVKPKATEE